MPKDSSHQQTFEVLVGTLKDLIAGRDYHEGRIALLRKLTGQVRMSNSELLKGVLPNLQGVERIDETSSHVVQVYFGEKRTRALIDAIKKGVNS